MAEPPGDDPATAVQLAVGPVLDRPIVAAHAEGKTVGVAVLALIDYVEQARELVHTVIVAAAQRRGLPRTEACPSVPKRAVRASNVFLAETGRGVLARYGRKTVLQVITCSGER